jgi:thiol-disulfide isomerase/thioredoxin
MSWQLYLIIAIIIVILLIQVFISHQAKRALGLPAPNTIAVDGAVHNMPRRVYYFYATHCHHCKAMTPIVDQLSTSHPNLIKININEMKDIAREFRIAATPSFVLAEDGIVREVLLGSQSEKKLKKMLAT